MIFLRVEHHKTFVEKKSDKSEVELIRKELVVFKQKFQLNQYQEKEWDITYLFSLRDQSFPTAYLDEVLKICEKENIPFLKEDARKNPRFTLKKLEMKGSLPLRNEQQEALEKIIQENTGIVMMPTASGKSRVIIHAINQKKVRTLIIVPRRNLQTAMAKQLKEIFGNSRVDTVPPKYRYKKDYDEEQSQSESESNSFKMDREAFGANLVQEKKESIFKDISIKNENIKKQVDWSIFNTKPKSPEQDYIKDKKRKLLEKKKLQSYNQKKYEKMIKLKEIYVLCDMMLDSLDKSFLEQFEMVIVDECHHAAGKVIRDALLKMKNAAYRYYFSATPWRDHSADEKLLISSIGSHIIFELSPQDAIKHLNIAKPEYIVKTPPNPKVYVKEMKKWREILEFGIIGNETRNKMIVDDALSDYDQGKNVFIAVDEITHINILKERFLQLGVETDIIHGEISGKINDETILKVGMRTKGICIGTMSVGEGTDMPNIDSVIIASGGKSSIRFLQRIGRGARKGTEQQKVLFTVHDYFDWYNPTLLKHSLKRKEIFDNYYKNFE